MRMLIMVILFMAGFLIMDAVCDQRVQRASTEAKKEVRYVPLSIYDEQLSGRTLRDDFTNLFYSSGPWMFRDDAFGITRPEEKLEDEEALDLTFQSLQRRNGGGSFAPDEIAAERRRVEESIRMRFDQAAERRLRKRSGVMPEESTPVVREGLALRGAPVADSPTPAARIAKRKQRKSGL